MIWKSNKRLCRNLPNRRFLTWWRRSFVPSSATTVPPAIRPAVWDFPAAIPWSEPTQNKPKRRAHLYATFNEGVLTESELADKFDIRPSMARQWHRHGRHRGTDSNGQGAAGTSETAVLGQPSHTDRPDPDRDLAGGASDGHVNVPPGMVAPGSTQLSGTRHGRWRTDLDINIKNSTATEEDPHGGAVESPTLDSVGVDPAAAHLDRESLRRPLAGEEKDGPDGEGGTPSCRWPRTGTGDRTAVANLQSRIAPEITVAGFEDSHLRSVKEKTAACVVSVNCVPDAAARRRPQ